MCYVQATRGSNCLLEVCSPKDKKCLVQKDDTRALMYVNLPIRLGFFNTYIYFLIFPSCYVIEKE